MSAPLSAVVALWSVVMALCICGALWSLFMLARNNWVYRQRMAVLNDPAKTVSECLRDFDRLPTYDQMMRRFWIWRIEDFKQ